MYRRTVDSLLKPKMFFKKVKPEMGYRNPFLFLLIVMSVTFLFLTYHYVSMLNNIMQRLVDLYNSLGIVVYAPEINFTFATYIAAYLILLISSVLMSFLWYYITHLCVRLVGGKHGYNQTYKAMTYSLSADYLSLPAFIVSFVTLAISLVKSSLLIIIIFIISTILYLIPSFYRLYLRLVGLERLQEISKLKAFIAAYPMSYFFVTIAMLIIYIVLILIAVAIFMVFGLDLPF